MYRHAYIYFALALAVTLAGFWPSFFSDPAQNDAVRIAHGALATAWMLMLIGQSWLIAHRRVTWHRRVGKLSYLLAPAMVISMSLVIHSMLTRSHGFPHDLKLSLTFIDLASVIFFALLYGWRSGTAGPWRSMPATCRPRCWWPWSRPWGGCW